MANISTAVTERGISTDRPMMTIFIAVETFHGGDPSTDLDLTPRAVDGCNSCDDLQSYGANPLQSSVGQLFLLVDHQHACGVGILSDLDL